MDFSLEMGESLGLMIRGGAEYGLGIFVTGVDVASPAVSCEPHGLCALPIKFKYTMSLNSHC